MNYQLAHVEWDGKEFVRVNPQSLPSLELGISPLLEYHELFFNIKYPTVSSKGSTILVFTDTCAQTCVSGIELLHKLNLATDILIPTSHKIIGVTGRNLDILGVLVVKLQHLQHSAQAAVYICNHINEIFVSSKIQMELGIIRIPEYQQVFRTGIRT